MACTAIITSQKILDSKENLLKLEPVILNLDGGFGTYQYQYKSGREGEWMLVGFSPRKQNISLYIMSGFSEFEGLLAKLGKHKTSKACLYINKLADVDTDVLRELVKLSSEHVAATNQ